ncbi:hypothetical protein BH23ACT6_BH23ACT6_25100 [soil metagenome]
MLANMSIEVKKSELGQAIQDRPYAYLLSPGRERPHVVQVVPTLADGVLYTDSPGRSAVALAQSHPHVTLLYPPDTPEGHSLIVDGTAHPHGEDLHIAVDHAVLHRRATADSPPSVTGCGADCHPVEVGEQDG